ncbi:hypothetical protein [Microbacterium sp. SCN 69-37]|jgi:hypothetical protein|uniref:hypothetical protein n=1 Tax=Microbacterium sp. SCN 69-37 TaxID=1660115 RepID=UPI00086B8EB6|nr:hypothetical protein [Microbacterium sp. SCN 69-37]ODT25873.1 MAG: hypothetical protein ABS64_00495 [Microbacterium sp. SCN 69-37]
MVDVTHHQRIRRGLRRITRTARAIADLARELTRILAWVCAAGLVIAAASSNGGADLLLPLLELVGSIRR